MSANFNPKKNTICLATEDKIVLLSLLNGKLVERTIPVKKGQDVAVTPNHRLVAICQSENSTVSVADFNKSKEVAAFRHSSAAMRAAFDSKGKHLAIDCHDGTNHIRNLETKAEVIEAI